MESDADIIQGCLNGNQLAYKQLYERYIAYCYGMCTRYAVKQAEIKDVVQIIFTQVFQSLQNYDAERAKFKTWFTHVCINNILTHKKKELRRLPTQNLEDISELAGLRTENIVEENIDRDYLLTLIRKMPSNYQLVFNMYIVDGYTHDEISEKLNISAGSSRVILNRARKWLKKLLLTIH